MEAQTSSSHYKMLKVCCLSKIQKSASSSSLTAKSVTTKKSSIRLLKAMNTFASLPLELVQAATGHSAKALQRLGEARAA